jgi:DNA repair exonuclease SbcCD ATPase subunit
MDIQTKYAVNMKRVTAIIISLCGLMIMTTGCVKTSKEYLQLKAESDSLRMENAVHAEQMNEMLSLLNDIEADFQTIRDAENYLNIQQGSGNEFTPSARERIKSDMTIIRETLKKNKEQIEKLEQQLKNSNIQSTALRKTIERLRAEVDQKTGVINALQEELATKNIKIDELDQTVASLKDDVEDLASSNAAQQRTLEQQDAELNRAYYCFGTTRELKDQKILTGGGLFSKSKVLQGDFNRDYFIAADIRKLSEIPLFSSKAKVKSNHPEGSYNFTKDDDGNMIFHITDYKAFWSLGRYLVIEVN